MAEFKVQMNQNESELESNFKQKLEKSLAEDFEIVYKFKEEHDLGQAIELFSEQIKALIGESQGGDAIVSEIATIWGQLCERFNQMPIQKYKVKKDVQPWSNRVTQSEPMKMLFEDIVTVFFQIAKLAADQQTQIKDQESKLTQT